MKKTLKKVLLASTVLAVTAGLAACGNLTGDQQKAKSKDKSGDDTTTLLMYRVGEKPTNYDELMTEVNKTMKE